MVNTTTKQQTPPSPAVTTRTRSRRRRPLGQLLNLFASIPADYLDGDIMTARCVTGQIGFVP